MIRYEAVGEVFDEATCDVLEAADDIDQAGSTAIIAMALLTLPEQLRQAVVAAIATVAAQAFD